MRELAVINCAMQMRRDCPYITWLIADVSHCYSLLHSRFINSSYVASFKVIRFILMLWALSRIKYFCQRKGKEKLLGKPRHCWESSIKFNLKRLDAISKFKSFYRKTTSRRFLSSESMGGISLPLDHFWGNTIFRGGGCWLKFTVDHLR